MVHNVFNLKRSFHQFIENIRASVNELLLIGAHFGFIAERLQKTSKMADEKNSQSPSGYMSLHIIQHFLGILIIISVFFWIIHFRGGFSFTEAKIIFNWHALLMTIAFIYLFANAILHFRTFRNCKKQQLKRQHAIVHGSIVVLVLLAAIAALASHLFASPPVPNFYSMHSWLGIFTVTLYLSQFVIGIWSFLYPGAADERREALLPYHVFFGSFIFTLAVATAVLGFSEKLIFTLSSTYNTYPVEGLFGNFLGLLCVIYGGLVVYLVTKPEFKRAPVLEYEPLLGN